MVFSAFMACRHGQRLSPCIRAGGWRATALAFVLLAPLAGCVATQQLKDETPRDLLSDISVQSDRLAVSEEAKLALLLPLSGPSADIGRQLWDGAVLALFDSGSDDVILLPQDTQGTAIGAAAVAGMAIMEGTNAFVGPLFSSSVSTVKPLLAAHGLRGIALSNNRAVAGDPYFLIGSHPETQVDALASHLAASGRDRIELFGPDTPYLQLLRDRLVLLDEAGKITLVDSRLYRNSASYTDIAREVRAITRYDQRVAALKEFTAIFTESWQAHEDPEEALQSALGLLSERLEAARLYLTDFLSETAADRAHWFVTESEYIDALSELLQMYHRQLQVKEAPRNAMAEAVTEFELRETLGQAGVDAVLLPIGSEPLLVIAPMFEYFNASSPDVLLVGTDVWESAARRTPKDLLGSRYVTATAASWKDFQTRFEAAFGYSPDPLVSTVYDAVRVAITEKRETGQLSLAENFLTRHVGFDGVNGPFRFLADGTNLRTLEIVELHKDGTMSASTWHSDPLREEPHTPVIAEPDMMGPIAPSEEPAPSLPPISTLEPPNPESG